MMPILTSGWALLGLAVLPALVAIYLFQRRFRSREVSSLLLWDAVQQASMGGRTREKLRLPLAFWLELAAIVLIVLAAAGPLLPRWSHARPLVLVLDDSLSMSLARDEALRALRPLASRGHDPLHVVFAGATPQLAGGATFDEQLRGWRCDAPSADLDAAIGFATQVGGPNALVMVATDHAPDAKLESGSLEWRAFGATRANVAFAAAARSGGAHDRVLLEIASYAKANEQRTLTLGNGQTMSIALRPGERKRLQFDAGSPRAFEATLSNDDATFDDRVVLLPESRPPVRVAVRVTNAELRAEVQHALRATSRVTLSEVNPELVVRSADVPSAGPAASRRPGDDDAWSVVLHAAKANDAVTGPFVVDRAHPLLRGLALDGLIWGVSPSAMPGEPVVLAGKNVLVSDERVGRGHRVHVRFDPTISNLQRAPLWPALWWNVIDWRSANAPGVRASNVTLGSDARVTVDAQRVRVTSPDGATHDVDAIENGVIVAALQSGIWSVDKHRFAVNAIVPAESDLTHAASGTWGGWSDESLLSSGYQDGAWMLLLCALALLALHQWVLSA